MDSNLRLRAPRTRAGTSAIVAVIALSLAATIVSSCASLGTGRPEVVKSEDVLVNSLAVYGAAMTFHKNHSKEESVEVYGVLEKARVDFPPAWETLSVTIKAYKKTGGDATALTKARVVVEAIVASLQKTGVL